MTVYGDGRRSVDGEPTGESVSEQAEYLRHRIDGVIDDLVDCQTALAHVLDRAAWVRPHAAGRLQDAAHRARCRAEELSDRRNRCPVSGR